MVKISCDKCKNVVDLNFGGATTLICHNCACQTGIISVGDMKAIEVSCCRCEYNNILMTERSVPLTCTQCGYPILNLLGEAHLSSVIVNPSFPSSAKSIVPSDMGLPVRKFRFKVGIPYYENAYVKRAAQTWLYPETVFFLTDPGVIPPGFGICQQIMLDRSGKSLGFQKSKPFMKDILIKLLEYFPNEDFYGLFNSDIILPLGKNVSDLLPHDKLEISYHHRYNVDGHIEAPIRDLQKKYPEQAGKDGFFVTKKIAQMIIKEFGDPLLGSPGWDDSLLAWLVNKLGRDKIDVRWGEIYHAVHQQRWSYQDKETEYNFKTMARSLRMLSLFDGEREFNKKGISVNKKKKIGIIQPGRNGDIIIVLPIAKWYFDRGYEVYWPIPHEFINLFNYVNYVIPIDMGNCSSWYSNSKAALEERGIEEKIDLGIGFGRDEKDWIKSGFPFNVWKYYEASVPFEERFNIQINRNLEKEMVLQSILSQKYTVNGDPYVVTHEMGSWNYYKWEINPNGKRVIPISPVPNFSIFDWIGVLERAQELFIVDSCFTVLADQFRLCEGNRTVRYWDDYREPTKERKRLGHVRLSDDWRKINHGPEFA